MLQTCNFGSTVQFPNVVKQTQISQGPDLAANWVCRAFSGVFVSNERLFIGDGTQLPDQLSLSEAATANGEWFAVFENADDSTQFIVITDQFGFQPAYYAFAKELGLVVSTSAEEANWVKNRYGVASQIDSAQLALYVCTNHSWSSTFNSDYTAVDGVKMARAFEYLWINGDSFASHPIDELQAGLPSEYDELLEFGIKNAVAQLEQLSQLDVFDRRINLSGGKDSRLMFGLLSKGGLTDAFTVRSVNPKTWPDKAARKGLMKDLLIADSIRERFGMQWSTEGERVVASLSPAEALRDWQKYRSSKNFRFHLKRKFYARTEPIIELRGASGECFRNFWSHYFKYLPSSSSIVDETSTFDADTETIFDDLYKDKNVSEGVREAMLARFTESLKETGFSTFLEAADRHFSLYRNRGHFGTTLHFMQEGAVPFFPLNQLAFVRAGELVSVKQRKDGIVFFDLIEKLDPSLNDLPFDSAQWPAYFWEKSDRQRSEAWTPTPEDSPRLEQYFENEAQYTNTIHSAKNMDHGPAQIYGDKSFAYSMVRDLLDELQEVPGGEFLAESTLRAWLLNLVESNVGYALFQVSKLISVRDTLNGKEPFNFLMLGGKNATETKSAELKRFTASPFEHVAQLSADINPLLFRITLDMGDREIHSEILVDQASEAQIEYAFYLKVDGKVVEHQAYSTSNLANFARPESGQQVWVQGFVRKLRGSKEPYILNSVRASLAE